MVPGDSTRPIKDLVKESLFNIIGTDIQDATLLDLFAGTGAVSIEALSRGARSAILCDLDRMAIKTIHENLKTTKLADQATVRRIDSLAMLRDKTPGTAPDFIYVAPPQYKGLWLTVLETLDAHPVWLSPETRVIVQIDPSEHEDVFLKELECYDERRYGKTMLLFFMRRELNLIDEAE